MEKKSKRAPIIVVGIAGAALLYLYFFASIKVVTIENTAGVDLDSVEIFAGSATVWNGHLDAGEKKLVIVRIKGEGSFLVRVCESASSECNESRSGYFTGSIAQKHVIEVDNK